MGLFGSSKDKETIERLTKQLNQQRAEYERKISEKDSEMSELKAKYSKREDSILAVKEIELQKLKDKIKALEDEISNKVEPENKAQNKDVIELKNENCRLKSEIAGLVQELENTKKKFGESKIREITIDGIGKGNLLEAGEYKAGVDFPEGKCDFYALEGEGYLSCTKGDISSDMSTNPHGSYVRKYRNLSAPKGCKIEVSRNLKLLMYHSRPIEPKIRDYGEENIISSGQYKIGTDIPEGKYVVEIKSGKGYIDDEDDICIKFGEENINDTTTKARIILKKGKILTVDENLELYLYEAVPLTIEKKKYKSWENRGILCGGVYEAGIDIPYGYYNIILEDGSGAFELETMEGESDFYEKFSQNGTKRYDNLLIGIGNKVTIESGLEVSMEFSKPYIEENISKKVLKEIDDVKKEMEILSNDIIVKYYKFSDYESITSEDCKNKLMILKQEEKQLRDLGKDVIVIKKEGGRWKLDQRTTRQILRSFNMECDNIMLNVGLKNIDKSRKKIQQSFETLNKLYSVDGVELTKKILELKLEQITLMYTYELKYQQEKDIQRAIKEQMLEEAKAQREIEEQKKKIEKDLQQHLGEVNRIMKYMQKTQIDAEKQLYMDKIKELEEKIKVLQSDKEMVLEREANAKAGFVYIISNIGSFGENIYKIGMTRRLEPMDRIHELSSASVPFEFDVHAMIFSSDAPELETTLHRHFANNAVNKVNPRKEFYNVDIDEIERVVKENYNDTVQFTKIPIAAEYRQSLNLMESAEQKPPVLQGVLDIEMEIEDNE